MQKAMGHMLRALYEQRGDLEVYDTRDIRPGYCEFVVYAKDMETWESRFAAACGKPAKPAGVKSTPQQRNLSDGYGGIDKNQTLYYKQEAGRVYLVMLWPWRDGEYVTVKMVETPAGSVAGGAGAGAAPAAAPEPAKRGRAKKVVLTGIAAVVGVVVIVCLLFALKVQRVEREIDSIAVGNVDVGRVGDGVYDGELDVWAVSARVRVLVRNGRIEGIELLEHNHGPDYGAEGITERIIEQQSLEVDAISGATTSSKVIRKAVELALRKGIKQPSAAKAGSEAPEAGQ